MLLPIHLVAVATALEAQAFGVPRRTRLTATWGGCEASGVAGSLSGDTLRDGEGRQLHLLQQLASDDEVRLVQTEVDERSARFDTVLDTVDDKPTYLWRIIDEGEVVDERLHEVLAPLLHERLVPFVREKYGCPGACLADVLIRRYNPDERRRLEAHFDVSSFATAIVALSDAHDYEGGLYVQAVPGVASRRFVELEAGDGVVHQFDLMHGVHVPSGSRLSLVAWFSDSEASLRGGRAPWVLHAAESGNEEAMFVLGGFYDRGDQGYELNATLAAHWLGMAAMRGHAGAQTSLGTIVAGGTLDEKAMNAMEMQMGELDGATTGTRYERRAVELFRRAAAQGHPTAQYLLGRAYLRAEGVCVDLEEARHWLGIAAAHGSEEVEAAAWAEADLEELDTPNELAAEWLGMDPEQQQLALDHINAEQRANGLPEWDMAALRRMMGLADEGSESDATST